MFCKTQTWQTLERQGGAERGFNHLKWEGSVGIFKYIKTNILVDAYIFMTICWGKKICLLQLGRSGF